MKDVILWPVVLVLINLFTFLSGQLYLGILFLIVLTDNFL